MNIDELWKKYRTEHNNGFGFTWQSMSKKSFTEAVGEIISNPVEAEVMQKIAEGLIKEFENYLLDIKNCEEIKNLKYKTDIDFASLLFRIIAKRIIEKYASNFTA